MLLEMGIIVAGIPAGWLLRKSDRAKSAVGRVLTWAVWALLFLLGLALGSDDELLRQISRLGLRAAVISTLSVVGCLVFARLLGRFLDLDKNREAKTPAPDAPASHPRKAASDAGAARRTGAAA